MKSYYAKRDGGEVKGELRVTGAASKGCRQLSVILFSVLDNSDPGLWGLLIELDEMISEKVRPNSIWVSQITYQDRKYLRIFKK